MSNYFEKRMIEIADSGANEKHKMDEAIQLAECADIDIRNFRKKLFACEEEIDELHSIEDRLANLPGGIVTIEITDLHINLMIDGNRETIVRGDSFLEVLKIAEERAQNIKEDLYHNSIILEQMRNGHVEPKERVKGPFDDD